MPAQDDLQKFQDLAERMRLEDDEAQNFIGSGMKRLGYKPRLDWDEPEPEDGDKGGNGDFFSTQRQKRDQRRVGGQNNGGGQGSGGSRRGSDWQYADGQR